MESAAKFKKNIDRFLEVGVLTAYLNELSFFSKMKELVFYKKYSTYWQQRQVTKNDETLSLIVCVFVCR